MTARHRMTVDQFREALDRGAYAWPGGYPVFFVMADGEPLSFAAAVAERATIEEHLSEPDQTAADPAWCPVATEINWEDPALFCAHTSDRIESAYAEGEARE